MSGRLSGQHVAVLMGGLSSEREVSLVSGAACADALERSGAKVTRIDAGRDVADVLSKAKPDVVFNALHGEWGEDGCVQGVLETLGLAYTHSGVLASALAMDKAKAKAVLAAAGVTVPGGGLFDRFEAARDPGMAPPAVVKPNAEGSSVGVFLVFEGANGPPQELAAPSWTFGQEVMIEPYIAGKELAVAVMDGAGPGRDRDRGADRLLRLRGEVRGGRLDPRPACPTFAGNHQQSHADGRVGARCAWLSRGYSIGPSL